MDVTFGYERLGKMMLGEIWRPVAKVFFHSSVSGKWIGIWMIVDTGADYSILPGHISEKLKISLENDCVKDTTIGIGGTQQVYFLKKKLEAKLGSLTRKVPIGFFAGDEIPPIMGRLGFIETFDTSFLKSHVTVFKN